MITSFGDCTIFPCLGSGWLGLFSSRTLEMGEGRTQPSKSRTVVGRANQVGSPRYKTICTI